MFGLNIDPNNPKGNPEPTELRELGVKTVRYTFYDSSGGDQVDSEKAKFYSRKAEAYREAGLESLVILTYDTYPGRPAPDASNAEWEPYLERFARRAGQIAQRLAPWRPAYQVWNEPDHPVKGNYVPTLREEIFGQMLRRTRDAIKNVDPKALVVAGGLAMGDPSWLRRVIQSQGGQLPADIVAFHPYGQRPEPNWPNPDWAFGYVGDLLNQYYQAGQRKPIWITEMGVKEEDLGNNREQVAEFLNRFYRAITTRYSDKVQKLLWFCYSDGMVTPFGLVDGAGNRKPAYFAYLKAASAYQPPSPEPVAPPPGIAVTPGQPAGVGVSPPPPPTSGIGQPTTPPPPPGIPVSPTPPAGISADELAQLAGQLSHLQTQVQQLQNQMSQFQGQLQQLSNRQVQLQSQVQQLQSQPVSGSGPSIPIPPPISPTPVSRPAPPIQNITNQLKRHPTKRFPTRPLSQIQRIIIHHTAIPPHIGTERIASHRVDKQGWPGIGYHYFITGDGRIEQTNELTTLSTHAGQYDPIAIGICFAGDFTSVSPTSAQIEIGAQLIAWLLPQFGMSIQSVQGYKELINTQSPGLQWDSGQRWGDQLKARIQAYL